MASNSVVTQDKLQEFYNTKVYPYLNGSANLGFTPIGTVISVMSNEAPDNYLVCDGTAYNISEYSDLANFFEDQFGSKNYFGGNGTTTFAVPDLRGEFLRGTGTNSHTNQGSGANVGVHQDGTTSPRLETYDSKLFVSGNNISNYNNADSIVTANIYGTISYTKATANGQVNQIRSRPTNTSVLYCIAYKNIYISTGIGGYPVEVTNPIDGQIVTFDAANQKWVNGGHKYSTSEHVVGTWIDGRNIYEKTIEYTLTEKWSVGAHLIPISIPNIDHCINYSATYYTIQSASLLMPFTNSSTDYGTVTLGVITDSSIQVRVGGTQYLSSGATLSITLQYNKITD